jgi:hypothetical protein
MKKEIEKTNSTMRFAFVLCVITACSIGFGAGAGFVIAVIMDRDIALIGAALGGLAGIIGAILVPAFGGKAIQKKFETDLDAENLANNNTNSIKDNKGLK